MSKFRAFTLTSFADEPPTLDSYQYICYQAELCPTTGRKHWQGFVYFTNARSLNATRKALGGLTHVEVSRDIKASIQYCQKKETAIPNSFYEDGVPPHTARNKGWWQELTIQALWEEEPDWMIKHYNGVLAYHKTKKVVKFARNKPQVIIYWGPPGTGKSHKAREFTDNYYIKPSGQWWDGYFGQKCVIFDDFYSSEKYCDMLRWLSENPIKVPVKGSMIDLEADIFIITTNQNPKYWYPQIEDKSALERRVTDIIEMTELYIPETQSESF